MELWYLSVVLCGCQLVVLYGAPVPNYPPKEMIGYMKSFGYLQKANADGSPAETLYTEEGFREVIKQVQRFGGLNETGELDSETLALMDKPRCGVPDILRDEHHWQHNRTKRYIIAAPGWRRRRLTYSLSNWASSLNGRDASERLKQAFSLWSEIAPLRFLPSSSPDADVVVSFGRGNHGDGYPFDGPGNTLAHAFFPSQHGGGQGGDIHFDGDEDWVDTRGKDKGKHDGVDFMTVATHEIGHSLGLAHSTSPGSIMFPYYKGHTDHLKLGYDDVLAMYDLYVRQAMFEDGPLEDDNVRGGGRQPPQQPKNPREGSNGDERRKNAPVTPRYPYPRDDDKPKRHPTESPRHPDRDLPRITPRHPDRDPPRTTPVQPVPTRHPNAERPKHEPRTEKPRRPVVNDGDTRRHPNRTPEKKDPGGRESTDNRTKIPDICSENMDAAALLRNELFFFKGSFMWRFRDRGMPFNGYPIEFHHFFRGLPKSVKRVDAIYQRPTDHKIVIFSGRQIWVYTGDRFTPESPQPLSSLGLPANLKSLDAAFVWSKNEKTYFFKGDNYWRYDERSKTMDEGYPLKIHTRWIGVPNNVDTAVTFNDGQTYFFKDQLYWRFDNIGVKIDVNFPRRTAEDWFGC